ncbi:Cleavage polyadenylation factor subunit clp1 [Tilletia horrida]|nr:Cleavage polyadenylation factor subunit clp1 [Tilletia horrida]
MASSSTASASAPASASATAALALPTRRQRLPPRSEFRFELEPGERISFRLLPQSGDAEVFGAPLVAGEGRWYPFGEEAKAAVASWTGAELEMSQAAFESISDEPSPTFTTHTKLHLALERSRIQARSLLRANPTLVHSIANAPAVVQPSSSPISFEAGSDAPQTASASSFAALSANEATAYRAEGQGPRVMIVGGESSGKSSLVKFLANYAMRSPAVCSLSSSSSSSANGKEEQPEITGWWPVIVNLDPGDGAAPLPFTFSALPLQPLPTAFLASSSPALPYGLTTSTTGAIHPTPTSAHIVSPYTLWLGRDNVRENEMHAKRVVDWLAEGVERRLARDARARMSGLVIDTPGVITADGRSRYAWIQYCARAFKVDTIVVLGHDKLNIELSRLYGHPSSGVSVVKFAKSGGVVELDDVYRSRLRSLQVRTYFYGGSGPAKVTIPDISDPEGIATKEVTLPGHDESLGGVSTLSAFSSSLPLDLMWVWRVGQEAMAPSSALPIGAQRTVTQTQLVKLDPASSSADQATLLHSIVALVQTPRGTGPKVGAAKAKAEAEAAAAAAAGIVGGGGLGDEGDGLSDDEILGSPVVGFIHVADMDLNRKTMTVLAPMKGKLPALTGLVGALEWTDA